MHMHTQRTHLDGHVYLQQQVLNALLLADVQRREGDLRARQHQAATLSPSAVVWLWLLLPCSLLIHFAAAQLITCKQSPLRSHPTAAPQSR